MCVSWYQCTYSHEKDTVSDSTCLNDDEKCGAVFIGAFHKSRIWLNLSVTKKRAVHWFTASTLVVVNHAQWDLGPASVQMKKKKNKDIAKWCMRYYCFGNFNQRYFHEILKTHSQHIFSLLENHRIMLCKKIQITII